MSMHEVRRAMASDAPTCGEGFGDFFGVFRSEAHPCANGEPSNNVTRTQIAVSVWHSELRCSAHGAKGQTGMTPSVHSLKSLCKLS